MHTQNIYVFLVYIYLKLFIYDVYIYISSSHSLILLSPHMTKEQKQKLTFIFLHHETPQNISQDKQKVLSIYSNAEFKTFFEEEKRAFRKKDFSKYIFNVHILT